MTTDKMKRSCEMVDDNEITSVIIGAAIEVSNQLGTGFLEKVYENALVYELRIRGYFVEQQKQIEVYYKEQVVGHYFADLFVEHTIPVELKAASGIGDAHIAQAINELRSTNQDLGLILSFGTARLGIKRLTTKKIPPDEIDSE
jgi:GxxExxY protein